MSQSSFVKCHHVYEPQREDELKLNIGDVVEVTSKEFDTWWVGKNLSTQQSGWFPTNFVTPTEKPEIESEVTESRLPPQQLPPPPPPDSPEQPISQPESEPAQEKPKPQLTKGNSLAEVKHDYEAQASDELTLEKGAIVTILEEVDGWCKGDLNGHVGLFPANFVSRIESKPIDEATEGEHEGEEAQAKPKGFKLAAYGVKQGGIGSLFSGGIPSLKKSNRHSLDASQHQIPAQETANEQPATPPKKSIPLPPPPQPEPEEVAASKPPSSLPPVPQEPEKPEPPRVSTDSSVGRQSIEEPTSPSSKRKSGFGSFRPPIPKIPIPKFPSLPKKSVPAVPAEVKTAPSPSSQPSTEPVAEPAQPISPRAPHAKVPLPPIPSSLPPSSPDAGTPPPPPQVPHVRSPLPPVPQEEPQISVPLPSIPQRQAHIRSPLPPVPQVPHFDSPSGSVEVPVISPESGSEHVEELHQHSGEHEPSEPEVTQEAPELDESTSQETVKPDNDEEEKSEKAPHAPEHSGPKLALVEDDFDAQSSSHLTLRKGGVVTILEQGEDWWRGEMNGKIGLFPPHLVKLIEQPAGEADHSSGNAPRGGFRLAAYGVKQGGIGGLFAGGMPKLRKTGRRMGSDEPSAASNEAGPTHPASAPVPASAPQLPVAPSRSSPHEPLPSAPQLSRSSTHESVPTVPTRSSTHEFVPQLPTVPARSSTHESVPQVSSAPSRTSIYESEPEVPISPRSDAREATPPVPSVPSRTSTRESLPQVPSIPSRSSYYAPESEPEPQGQRFSRASTHESLPQVPSVPSRTSTYEPKSPVQSSPHSNYEAQTQSPNIPSRTSIHESMPQVPSIPSRTTSDSSFAHAEFSDALDSARQLPQPPVRSESDDLHPQPRDGGVEPEVLPAVPARSEISPQIPSRVTRPTPASPSSQEPASHSIPSRSSMYSIDSEHSGMENALPTARNVPEIEADPEAPEPAPSSRTSFYRMDTPHSPTPGRSGSYGVEPHSPTTPLPSGNGSQTELPMPTGLPHRESNQEMSLPSPPRRTPSVGSGSEPSQRNSFHGSPARRSIHENMIASPRSTQEEVPELREETIPAVGSDEEGEKESKLSLKSENDEFYEASSDLEIPHEPEPTPNIATPRYADGEASISTNLDQVDRALESKSLEDQQKRNIDQVEPTFTPDDRHKKQELGSPEETSTPEASGSVVTDELAKPEGDAGLAEELETTAEESKEEVDQQVPEESVASLPALPEVQPLSSLTKGRPLRTKRKPTPVARDAVTSQTQLLEKAIEEDTVQDETKEVEKPAVVEPVKSREIPEETPDTTEQEEQPRLIKPSALRGQATPFAKLSFGKSGVPVLPSKSGHVGELGRRIGSGNLDSGRGESTSTADTAPRKFGGVAGAAQALALGELENKMRAWMKEEMDKLREELVEERNARIRLEEELRELKESRAQE
ncbi:hypothetical protein K493DRAFT_313487 [Basidiobolus meristosporus CBS 931.73]|uniref:SH3 domain-containing protein n=1 Tax=Basidiobolus meristosporus CBS 931.73 TaxID=1314790 RepID=A0A1Y1YLC8_9FUNG|nr:hypothetical protein K493DRAFT_313487 [Basidiobolus meristosporus CBS 931.73]|eukprot:ORX98792.1 hypothetical protein K493DRAFT_313487 [Basidiobolus meristosporus CBS 931.73]